MDTISKSALKAKMFEYLRMVESTQKPLIVTDDGEPVIQILPFRKAKTIAELFSPYRHRISDLGDVEGDVLSEWGEDDVSS